ncbi:hypothetical protein niasHS_001427 [Heterodera schachtii]|uniref:Uncharacterized protein n=1 Tax=Heterodera schachtii TaxID=97005 RepID=A0ABD2KDG4_HETSC
MEFPYHISVSYDENIENAEINTMYNVVADQLPPPVQEQLERFRLSRPVLNVPRPLRPPLHLLDPFVSPRRFNVPRQAVANYLQMFPHTFRPIIPRLLHHRSSSDFWSEDLCLINFSHRINWNTRRIVVTLRARVENGRELVRGHFTQETTEQIEEYFGCGFVFYQLPQVQWDAAIVTFYGTLDNWDFLLLYLYDILTAIEQGTEPPYIDSPMPNSSPNFNGQKTPEDADSCSSAAASPNAADSSSSAPLLPMSSAFVGTLNGAFGSH